MDIGEIIALPSLHSTEEAECPFCTPDEKTFKTYPGSAKSEAHLKAIMGNPSSLPSKESGARPKEGGEKEQQLASPKPYPKEPLTHEVYGVYTYEAHHLIPGNEKLDKGGTDAVINGHAIEKWIDAGDKVEKDSGYSINNSDNGVWLPSVPVAHKKGPGGNPVQPWASEAKTKQNPDALTAGEKTAIAEFAMERGEGQFHYGPHKVSDSEGAHYTYPSEVAKRLTALNRMIQGWSEVCLCDGKTAPPSPPFKPTWKMHEKLDLISMMIEIDIRLLPAATWTYFLSTLARDYQKKMQPRPSI